MAKNTASSAFRKIDVDQYNEDNFREDDPDFGGPGGPDENEISGLMNQGKHFEALRSVLQNAPLGSKNQQVKVGLGMDFGLIFWDSLNPSFRTMPSI